MFSFTDYSLNNPDTLTKYKTAGQISEKVLAEVTKLCVPGTKIIEICQKGDKLLEEEIAKVYRGKKVHKGKQHASSPAAGIASSSSSTPHIAPKKKLTWVPNDRFLSPHHRLPRFLHHPLHASRL